MATPLFKKQQVALQQALQQAARLDPDIEQVIKSHGYPEPRHRENSLSTLLQIIVSQQLSTQSAAAIWSRVIALIQDEITADKLLSYSDQALRDCGLSWRKVEYAKALALQIQSQEINLEQLATQELEDIVATLTKIKGFGRWSAEIYAMFSLQHPDIYPAGDLALQIAIQRLKKLDERPSEQQTRDIAKQWSPHQSAVSLLMWHYYGSATLD